MTTNQPNSSISGRDLRIDFFRGLAIYMILVDHVIDDPISKFTYQNLGFSDAAEIFVFLSGVSCGIAYSRVLARRGWDGFLASTTRRAIQLYVYYFCTSIVTIVLINAAGQIVNQPLIQDPVAAIRSTIFLISPPPLPAILKLYIELTIGVIPLFLITAQRSSAGFALAGSGFIWTITQFYPSIFNFFSWQFLFCIGMFIGTRYDSPSPGLSSRQVRSWFLLAAWSIVIVSFAYRLLLLIPKTLQLNLDWLRLSEATLTYMKANLSPIRILHFLSVAFLVATYIKNNDRIFGWPLASVIIKTGRCSLQTFCMVAILSVVLNIIGAVEQPVVFEKLVLDTSAILLIGLMAIALTKFRGNPQLAVGPHRLILTSGCNMEMTDRERRGDGEHSDKRPTGRLLLQERTAVSFDDLR